jgi:hypothetical protein
MIILRISKGLIRIGRERIIVDSIRRDSNSSHIITQRKELRSLVKPVKWEREREKKCAMRSNKGCVGDGSHSWIACRSRARRPSVYVTVCVWKR